MFRSALVRDSKPKWAELLALMIMITTLVIGSSRLYGQGATAALNGSVIDPLGSPIAGAHVSLVDLATQITRTAVTDNSGLYAFVSVTPGQYFLTISKQGFQTFTTQGLSLNVNQTLTQNAKLAIGQKTQQVTVRTSSENIETTTTELGTAIQTNQVVGLPLNGRNYTQLLTLIPGTSPINTDQSSGTGFGGHEIGSFTFPSVNGQPNRSNMFLLDGFTDYAFLGNYAVAPIIDAIQEFKVQSHNDSAAYGGAIGGIVNVLTRGGTQEYHGAVWEFFRNSALDSKNYFNTSVTPYKQNQFGGDIGGPLFPNRLRRHPRLAKTFFFLAYEGFRSDQASEQKDVLPTQAELNGDFSGISTQLYNPFTTAPDPNNPGSYTRDPFPNNQIPQA